MAAPCHYCGPLSCRGCVTRSYFNSALTTVADAFATGKCTHIPNATVCKVLMDPQLERLLGHYLMGDRLDERRRIR